VKLKSKNVIYWIRTIHEQNNIKNILEVFFTKDETVGIIYFHHRKNSFNGLFEAVPTSFPTFSQLPE
jgi:hypothetical protein